MFEEEKGLDTQALEEAVAKETEEETQEDSTPSETSTEEKTDQTHTEETSEDTTSLKSEEETEETKETKETDEDRFDKHPRFQQLRQERDDLKEDARRGRELEETLGNLPPDEIRRLSQAGQLLQKYPELKEKVQKVIDEHPYGREQVDSRVNEVARRQEELENKIINREVDDTISKLMLKNKVEETDRELIEELTLNRIANKRVNSIDEVPEIFDGVLKSVEKIRRKTLASAVKDKSKETKVPASTTKKGKLIAQKKESVEAIDVISELAQGIKAGSEPLKE